MSMAKPRERLPTGHRQLVNLLIKGGLIQPDESGIAWVSASRSHGYFTNAAVERIKERGFHQDRQHYVVVASNHTGKWMAVRDGAPRPRRKKKEAAA